MPSNRAGKIIRCPECKKVIRLGVATKTEIQSGKPIPMSAEIVVSNDLPELEATESLPTIDSTSIVRPAIDLPIELSNLEDDANAPHVRRRLDVPKNIEPPSIRRRYVDLLGSDNTPSDQIKLERRVSSANADRVVLSKFFAICLCLVAVINLVPAIYFWVQWSRTFESSVLPRWIYLQVFIAALHLIYAVFLVQIRDWSALKSVSVAMLAVAFIFGVVSTGLLTGGRQGVVAQFLELPNSLVSQAGIWCVAMLCLSTLMCYMGGRVAVNWQRTEQLLREIIS